MEHLHRVAQACVARALGFAGLAIGTVTLGLIYDPLLAARSAAVMMTLLTIGLLIKAHGATRRDYRRTELWLMLPQEHRPPAAYAQWAASTVLRDTYLWFAQFTAALSAVTWGVALLLSLAS